MDPNPSLGLTGTRHRAGMMLWWPTIGWTRTPQLLLLRAGLAAGPEADEKW